MWGPGFCPRPCAVAALPAGGKAGACALPPADLGSGRAAGGGPVRIQALCDAGAQLGTRQYSTTRSTWFLPNIGAVAEKNLR